MSVGIVPFQQLATQHPQAERAVVAPGTNNVQDGSSTSLAGRVFSTIYDSATGALSAENQHARETFSSALQSTYGDSVLQYATRPAIDAQPLSAAQIGNAIEHADLVLAAKSDLFAFAVQGHQDPEFTRVAMQFVMPDIKWPEGAHSTLLAPVVQATLEQLLPTVAPLDASARRDLMASLGSQLAERLEPLLMRGLSKYADGQNVDLVGKSVSDFVARLPNGTAAIPGLDGLLQREATSFANSVTTLMTRYAQDQADLSTTFCQNRPCGGLTALTIANSDPHKVGNRVGILSMENGSQVVYKPRDVRIDAAVAGNGPPASLIGQAGGPTFGFLARQDANHEHYGYVQCLPHGTVGDHLIAPQNMPTFYNELGRSTAALAMAGATDIHHENIMVSGGRPYMTDLEFAFSNTVTTALETLLFDPVPANAQRALSTMMDGMMLDMAFTRGSDDGNVLNAPLRVENDRFQENGRSQDVLESVWATTNGTGQVIDNRFPPRDGGPSIHARFANDFAQGLVQGLTALTGVASTAMTGFVDGAQDFQVRHHPIDTSGQRVLVSEFLNQQLAPGVHVAPPQQRATTLAADALQTRVHVPVGPPRQALADAMGASYQVHDVPYFSRVVSAQSLLHDGHQPITWMNAGAANTDYFATPADAIAGPLGQRITVTPVAVQRMADIQEWASTWMADRNPDCFMLEDRNICPEQKTVQFIAQLRQAAGE